jgi:hypothetical protein
MKVPTAHKTLQCTDVICQLQLASVVLFKRDLMFMTELSGHQNLVCEIWLCLVNVTVYCSGRHCERKIELLPARGMYKDRK